MNKFSNKAFTLIELLVVITIIGILATWAVAVYTSQIQKWRDATRITSVNALKWWIEQFYQDDSKYPSTWSWFVWVKTYVPVLPKDPKTWENSNNTSFDYSYAVWKDWNGIVNQVYEVSTWLENSWNVTAKAGSGSDWWNDDYRLEIWIILTSAAAAWDVLDTNIKWKQLLTSWVGSVPWNLTCTTASWTTSATWLDCTVAGNVVMVIR
jgi:prepilin-type N-terminal cleavage/methylation domain-containing protein